MQLVPLSSGYALSFRSNRKVQRSTSGMASFGYVESVGMLLSQERCEVDGNDEEEDPDAELGHPLDVLREIVCEEGREKDAESNVDGFAGAERHCSRLMRCFDAAVARRVAGSLDSPQSSLCH